MCFVDARISDASTECIWTPPLVEVKWYEVLQMLRCNRNAQQSNLRFLLEAATHDLIVYSDYIPSSSSSSSSRKYYNDVARAAKSMIRLGLEPHHGVCILGFNAPEWFIGYMGGVMVRASKNYITSSCSSSLLIFILWGFTMMIHRRRRPSLLFDTLSALELGVCNVLG